MERLEQRITTQFATPGLQFGPTGAPPGKEASLVEGQLPRALAADPSRLDPLNQLGNLPTSAKNDSEAEGFYGRALRIAPDDPMTLVHLGNLVRRRGELAMAREYFEHALRADSEFRPAHLGLSIVLPRLGDPAEGSRHGRMAFQGRCVIPLSYRGEGPPIEVLKLVSALGGNVRTEGLLSDLVFRTHLVVAEYYEPRTTLPKHDLVFNAIGDADIALEALDAAQSIAMRSDAAVINPPAAVKASGRCDIARRLAAVHGIATAKTMTIPRTVFARSDAERQLDRLGFDFPLLLRTPGFHGGKHFVLVETPAGLPSALNDLPGDKLMAIEYLDARAADHKVRKYRVMMVDGRLYPLHAAISDHWKIHYFSADMRDQPAHRAEDREFLEDMPGVLGSRATAALGQLQSTVGLDYGGVDFGLNRQGDVLLFEANATMAIFPPEDDRRWDYRRPCVEEILRAVRRMLIDRARPADATLRNLYPRSC